MGIGTLHWHRREAKAKVAVSAAADVVLKPVEIAIPKAGTPEFDPFLAEQMTSPRFKEAFEDEKRKAEKATTKGKSQAAAVAAVSE